MKDFSYLIKNFFTHKDFLVSADKLPGTMFSPLHFIFSIFVLAIVIIGAILLSKKKDKIKRVFIVLWALCVILEVAKILWETLSGKTIAFEAGGILPLYPCSIFMYAMPFAIWGNEFFKKIGCGYVCTLGLLGGAINFFYPATILGNYSCISFAGFHTFFYHGTMLFTCLTMLISGYHTYKGVSRWFELILPSILSLIISIPANIVNFSPINSDYMFFKANSFFMPAIFGGVSDGVSTIIIYSLYIIVPALFYLPSFIANKLKK